jgi:hypothetical protein
MEFKVIIYLIFLLIIRILKLIKISTNFWVLIALILFIKIINKKIIMIIYNYVIKHLQRMDFNQLVSYLNNLKGINDHDNS